MSVTSDVIELLDIVHRNFPILSCRDETARAPPWFPSAVGGRPGPAMTLANMRELGVQRLIASCLNDAALIDVSSARIRYKPNDPYKK